MQVDVSTYISLLKEFLENDSIIESENIKLIPRYTSNGTLIAIEFKENRRVKFIEGEELILNFEFGHVEEDKYSIENYNYHYNDYKRVFRFEKSPVPHINDYQDIHWLYREKDKKEFHSKDLKKGVTNLNTEDINFYLMLQICFEYIKTEKYPLDYEEHYNNLILEIRRELKNES